MKMNKQPIPTIQIRDMKSYLERQAANLLDIAARLSENGESLMRADASIIRAIYLPVIEEYQEQLKTAVIIGSVGMAERAQEEMNDLFEMLFNL